MGRLTTTLALGLAAASLVAAHGGDAIVVNDGTADPGVANCEGAPDFTSVGAAEDHAQAGDTIIVCPGVYHENVFVETSDLKILGRDGAIMDGTGTDARAAFILEDMTGAADPSDIWVEKLTIDNFEIRFYNDGDLDPGQGNGIRAFENSTRDITITNNHIHDNDLIGIWTGYGDPPDEFVSHEKWKIENNQIDDNSFAGVYLANCSKCDVKKNSMTNNANYSVLVFALRGFEIDDVKVEQNMLDTAARGVYVVTSSFDGESPTLRKVKVKDNTITGMTTSGVEVREASGTTVEDVKVEKNTLTANPGDGVAVVGSAGADGPEKTTVKDNTITGGATGVLVDNGIDTRIEKNSVTGTASNGVHALSSTDVEAKKNDIVDAGLHGVSFDAVTDGKVEDNVITDPSASGVTLRNGTTGIDAKKNDVSEALYGVNLLDASANRIEENDVVDSDERGISLRNSDDNEVRKNKTEMSGTQGLLVDSDSTGNDFSDNELDVGTGGGNAGVDAEDQSAGGGTAGTANQYDKNDCDVSVPAGLC